MTNQITLPPLPPQFTIRPATIADNPGAVAVFNACSVAMSGGVDFDAEKYASEWALPGFNLETDCCVITTTTGEVVACAEFWSHTPHNRYFGWVRVHPTCEGEGLGTYLTQWLTLRAQQNFPLAVPESQILLECHTNNDYSPSAGLLLNEGYKLIRHFLRMRINMAEPPPAPTWPAGVVVKPVTPEFDSARIYLAYKEMFKDHWGPLEPPFEEGFPIWEHSMITGKLDYDPTLWFLAMANEEIVGLSLCFPESHQDKGIALVDTLGVARAWRRQGLGLALLQHSFGELYRWGKSQVALGVDADNLTGATKLYKKAGMQAVRQFDIYQKELRSGEPVESIV